MAWDVASHSRATSSGARRLGRYKLDFVGGSATSIFVSAGLQVRF
jgi:hypothetical protein